MNYHHNSKYSCPTTATFGKTLKLKSSGGLRTPNIFTPVIVTLRRSSIEAKWICKWKTSKFDEVSGAKARLTAKGFSQKSGIDNDETFAPTPPPSSIRSLVTIAVDQHRDFLHLGSE